MNDNHEFELAIKRDYKITEDNRFAQQFYSSRRSKGTAPTLSEEKAFAYIISHIKPTDTDLAPIEFDIKEFCDMCGLTAQQYYTHVKETLDRLMSRRLWLQRENGREDGYPYLIHVGLDSGKGKGTVDIHPNLAPFLLQLKGNYYQFTFHSILAMKSVHGIRLYKLLKSLYYKNRDVELEVDTLKGHLDCLGKYSKFYDFRRKVLNPALTDINMYSDLQVDMEPKKTGKFITSIVFHVIDLTREGMPEDMAEAKERYRNVEREINPDQMTFSGIFDSIGEYPL